MPYLYFRYMPFYFRYIDMINAPSPSLFIIFPSKSRHPGPLKFSQHYTWCTHQAPDAVLSSGDSAMSKLIKTKASPHQQHSAFEDDTGPPVT